MRALWVVLALAGCQLSDQAKVQDVAEEVCACIEPADQTCVATITKALGSNVAEICSQCVFSDERTCAAMVNDCIPLCFPQNPTPGGP